MKIYICGKVSGLPLQEAIEKFKASELQLIAAGFNASEIVNPMTFGITKEMNWVDAMAICLQNLNQCDAIYIQTDWRDSFGARREITTAQNLRLHLFYEETNDLKTIKLKTA